MTVYLRFKDWASALIGKLDEIYGAKGIAPGAPPVSGGSWLSSEFVSAMGNLYVLEREPRLIPIMKSLFDYTVNNLYDGYPTSFGLYSPTEANIRCVGDIMNLYLNAKDDIDFADGIFDLFNNVTGGLAHLGGNPDWPWGTYTSSTYGTTTNILLNSYLGSDWGTLNQHLSSAYNLALAYHKSGTYCYQSDVAAELIYSAVVFCMEHQNADGSFPRDSTGVFNLEYDLATELYLNLLALVLKTYGDITYNNVSMLELVMKMLAKHRMFIQTKTDDTTVPFEYIPFNNYYFLEAYNFGESLDKIMRYVETSPIRWSWINGLWYNIYSYADARRLPIQAIGGHAGLVVFENEELLSFYKRWLV